MNMVLNRFHLTHTLHGGGGEKRNTVSFMGFMRLYLNIHVWFLAGKYLEKEAETKRMLERLVAAGKKLFLISNSGFPFM